MGRWCSLQGTVRGLANASQSSYLTRAPLSGRTVWSSTTKKITIMVCRPTVRVWQTVGAHSQQWDKSRDPHPKNDPSPPAGSKPLSPSQRGSDASQAAQRHGTASGKPCHLLRQWGRLGIGPEVAGCGSTERWRRWGPSQIQVSHCLSHGRPLIR
jgi:hypothetical protein